MKNVAQVFVVGFNHKYIKNDDRSALLRTVPKQISSSQFQNYDIDAINVLQTCNRWELYGIGDLRDAIKLLKDVSNFKENDEKIILSLSGKEAIHHIFHVAAGLDSMVLGDQEILSQFKNSFLLSKAKKTLNGYLERLANTALNSAKEIRKNTHISKGTTSLSYSVIQLLKKADYSSSDEILLMGLGEFGLSILKNLKQYFPEKNICLSNRTLEKSKTLAMQFDCSYIKWKECPDTVWNYDIVISAFDSQDILFSPNSQEHNKTLIIDLSMPSPFSEDIRSSTFVEYYSLDDAAKLVNKSLKNRKESINPALKIMDHYIDDFIAWSAMYTHTDILKEWKLKLEEASEICPFFQSMDKKESVYYINKSMGHFAQYIKSNTINKNSEEVLSSYLQLTKS